jgi:Uma2 family endonuclease
LRWYSGYRVETLDLAARWQNFGPVGAVLCFQQVATKTQIPSEDYLRMTFEHDAEFVHGEVVERSMPDEIHSAIQFLILLQFGSLIQSYPLYPRPEIRMRVGRDRYRIAHIAVFAGSHPVPVPETPPLVVVEILSKDDRHLDLMQKLEEYREWGVPHIWVIDPSTKRFSMYTEFGLQNVSSLGLSDYPFELTTAELFANL